MTVAAENLLGHPLSSMEFNCICTEVHPRGGPVCRGCRALEMGRNCWEMATSPCCDLPRSACESCPIYAAAMRQLALTEKVRLRLEGGVWIEGEMYKQRGQRLSDALNDPAKTHFAITDAVVTPAPNSGREAEQHPVILVAKAATQLIYPIGEEA